MCGRYAFFRWPPSVAALEGFPVKQLPRWNIAPGQQVLMMRAGATGREVRLARWGLTPAWLQDLSRAPAQARAETLIDQPMFKTALRLRRCLLPANGFYEWRGTARKRPFWITLEQSPLYFAALWEDYPVAELNWLSTAVITQGAGSYRRPLILDEREQQLWLDPNTTETALLEILSGQPKALRERALATFVNNPELDAPECLTPA